MTPDEIRALPAGRALDALVAEKVMGWERRQESWYDEEGVEGTSWYMPGESAPSAQVFGWYDDCDYDDTSSWGIPPYSSDIAAAWTVVEKMQAAGWNMSIGSEGGETGDCVFYRYGDTPLMEARAATIPHAISLAALLATMERDA